VDVWYRYPGVSEYALESINLSFSSGKVYLVTGPNGSGKSTLLQVAAGLIRPVRGDVLLDNSSIFSMRSVRRLFGVLFQDPELMLFNPTVYDEITYSLRQIVRDESLIREKIREWLDFFSLDESILNKPTHALSYGYKKIIALISILVYEPKIVLLDEPHTNLSKYFIKRIIELIRVLRENNSIVIIASHSRSIYRDKIDSMIKLDQGRVKKIESFDKVL
ncbi:MAG: ABC transporter ATP-binding protein, partial [Sulfolobales archaeon]